MKDLVIPERNQYPFAIGDALIKRAEDKIAECKQFCYDRGIILDDSTYYQTMQQNYFAVMETVMLLYCADNRDN
jgi:hypothetical protein